MRLDEFLRHFVLAAAAADRRFARTQDARDVHAGIAVWESLVEDGGLGDCEPAELVDAHLAASMLYARRFEVRQTAKDLALARRALEFARTHARPGSFADLQVRMSTAAWLMLRFHADRDPADLDEAIAIWTMLLGTDAGALAAANLGRALLARHELSGRPQDLEDGRLLLGHATEEMPADHPARADVELALRAAS
ncbi:hypothetical protein [Solirubrobacter soli]|uniref:hypothetical protein n=1 Tax=Solirubrobacter soli TaxID=363832 RepID=UPI00041F9B7F|nr:hypothetical protein [Solirubrobacter soli]